MEAAAVSDVQCFEALALAAGAAPQGLQALLTFERLSVQELSACFKRPPRAADGSP